MFTLDLRRERFHCMASSFAIGAVPRVVRWRATGIRILQDRLFLFCNPMYGTRFRRTNSTSPADSGWATDPHGLTGCLANLANPPGISLGGGGADLAQRRTSTSCCIG